MCLYHIQKSSGSCLGGVWGCYLGLQLPFTGGQKSPGDAWEEWKYLAATEGERFTPEDAKPWEELPLRSSWCTGGMSAPSQVRQTDLCCYLGGVPSSHLAWGLLPPEANHLWFLPRGSPRWLHAVGASSWRTHAIWGLYRGGLLGCHPGWVLLSDEGCQTHQVPGGSPRWVPEERAPAPTRQTSSDRYLAVSQVAPSNGRFPRVLSWPEAEPRVELREPRQALVPQLPLPQTS